MVNNVEQVDPREVQMLQQYLNDYSQQIEYYSRQFEIIEQRRFESLAAIDTLKALDETGNDTVLLPLGGGASLRVRILDQKKVLLNIGADVVVERENNDVITYLQDRITEMEAIEKKLSASVEHVQKQAGEVARRIDSAYQQSQR
ncbi:MAG: prefoldin subunit alpha [Methanoculleus sp. SDB]|nr:MAG: prefoldin subunit alpha [Methanoculleus sp. SDB]